MLQRGTRVVLDERLRVGVWAWGVVLSAVEQRGQHSDARQRAPFSERLRSDAISFRNIPDSLSLPLPLSLFLPLSPSLSLSHKPAGQGHSR